MLQGAIPGKNQGEAPQDEVSIRFSRHADGSVLSSSISHLVYPLPEDQRILFKTFVEKLILKYGPISNMNEVNASEARWVFNAKGVLILDSWGGDVADYKRCNGIVPYITNSATRARIIVKKSINLLTVCRSFV